LNSRRNIISKIQVPKKKEKKEKTLGFSQKPWVFPKNPKTHGFYLKPRVFANPGKYSR
jgi:hypothetical protein